MGRFSSISGVINLFWHGKALEIFRVFLLRELVPRHDFHRRQFLFHAPFLSGHPGSPALGLEGVPLEIIGLQVRLVETDIPHQLLPLVGRLPVPDRFLECIC